MSEQEPQPHSPSTSSPASPAPELRADWRHVPSPRRLAPTNAQFDEIVRRHDASLASGIPTYIDPVSGFSVFTAAFLAQRNYCCESGCRHCPYEC